MKTIGSPNSKSRVFIVENIPLKSTQPMSVYLTELLQHFRPTDNIEINLIVAKSTQIDNNRFPAIKNIYYINSTLTNIKKNIWFSTKAFNILRREHQRTTIDIVHCIYPNSSLLAAILYKLFISPKVKIIYNVRSTWIEMIFAKHHIQSPLNRLIKFTLNLSERILVQFVDHFIFVSTMLHNYYNANYSIAKKLATISPGGADLIRSRSTTTKKREDLSLSSTDIVIGYVGVIDTSRELDKFLHIFYELSIKQKNLKLIFIGDGNDRSNLKKYVYENDLNDCVQFLGSIPHENIAEYIKSFNFGLCHLPKILVYEESFPQKIVEYLACNVPVLASNIKAHRYISQRLYGVHIYECSDDIAEIIENFNQEIHQDLRKYSYEEIAKTFINLYNSLSSPNPIL